MTRRAIACFQQDWTAVRACRRTDGEHAPTSDPLCGQALNAALFLGLYLLCFAALVRACAGSRLEPGHRHVHLRARAGSASGARLGRAASVPLALVSLARVPALAPPDGALAAAGPETAAELLAPRGVHRRSPAIASRPRPPLAAFSAAIGEAARYPNPVTIVAAIVEMADQRLVKDLFRRLAPPAAGPADPGARAGHRQARRLARALRAISIAGRTGRSRGDRPGRRRRAAARLPRPHPALLPPAARRSRR